MTSFDNGPAKGQRLMLKRAPLFLRVVEAGGKFDALDQLADEPEAGERLFAYRRVGEVGMCHIHRKGGGGWFTIANYALVAQQPDDATMRDTTAWRAWCHQEGSRT